MIFFGRQKTKGKHEAISTEWEEAKRLSVSQKNSTHLYEKLMYSYGYKINNRDFVYYNVPYQINEDGEAVFSPTLANLEDGVFWETVEKDDNPNLTLNRFGGDNEEAYLSIDIPQNIVEDFTLNEIIDQKQLSFTDANFELELTSEVKKNIEDLAAKLSEQHKTANINDQPQLKELQQYITTTGNSIEKVFNGLEKEAGKAMREAKWFPYSGWIYVPIFVEDSKGKKVRRARRLNVTPFNLEIDPTKETLMSADFINVSEKLTFAPFYKRIQAGEFSTLSKKMTMDTALALWNEATFYEFLPKNYPDAGLSRTTSLRWDNYIGSGKDEENESSFSKTNNAYGIIDYYYTKQLTGDIVMYTLLNGKVISESNITSDFGIDTYPLILFSEDPDIKRNPKYAGNLAFRLLSQALRIQKNNKKIAEAELDMEPVLIFQYIKNESTKDSHIETTSSVSGDGQRVYLIYNEKPETANNTSKIDSGANFFTPFIRELQEINSVTQQKMKEAAGITDFLEGTSAHSVASQSGINDMMAAGLKAEIDVVKSHSNSLSEAIGMELFMRNLDIVARGMAGAKTSDQKNRVTLSASVDSLSNIFTFRLESEYTKSQTNSIITNILLPLAAQSKQPELLFKLVEALPITSELKSMLDGFEALMKEKQKEELEAEKQKAEHQSNLSDNSAIIKGAISAALSAMEEKNNKKSESSTTTKKTAPKKTDQKKTENNKEK